jgi:hypothetical protein
VRWHDAHRSGAVRLTVLLLGAAGVTDDPGVLLTLVGAALWALACVHGGRAAAVPVRPWSSPVAGPATARTAPPASTIPTPPDGRVRVLPEARSRRSDLTRAAAPTL